MTAGYMSVDDTPRWATLAWADHGNNKYWLRYVEILRANNTLDITIYQRAGTELYYVRAFGEYPQPEKVMDALDLACLLIERYPER